MRLPLLPTSLVGSYAQPDWLIDRRDLDRLLKWFIERFEQ